MVDLEKDLSNFKLNIDKKDITIKEYIRLLTLGKKEYQKLLEENKKLKEALVRASKNSEKTYKKKIYNRTNRLGAKGTGTVGGKKRRNNLRTAC